MVNGQLECGKSAGECTSTAQELCSLILSEANLVQAFRGRWMILCSRLHQLHASLVALSESVSYNNYFKAILPQIVSSLEEGKELVQRSIDLSYGGKLLMQSNLDALATKLDLHLHDLELLRCSIRGECAGKPFLQARKGVWELIARLKIGNTEFKKSALDALVNHLRDDDKAVVIISTEGSVGDLSRLVHLLDSCVQSIREKAVDVVALLARENGCKKILMAEAVHSPLIRVLESGTSMAKEKAVEALLQLTVISEFAHLVASHGGIPALVKVCRHGTPAAMADAAGTLGNLATNEQIRRSLAEEGSIEALLSLVISGTPRAQEQATEALHNLACGRDDRIKLMIAQQGGIQSLLLFLSHATSPRAQELALRALGNLSSSATIAKALVTAGYVNQLVNILKNGTSSLQQLAASAICNLSSFMDLKKHLREAGSIVPLTKMLEAKDTSEKVVAAQAISTFFLADTGGKRREFVGKDTRTSIPRVVQLIDPRTQSLAKRFPMSAILSLSSGRNRKKGITSNPALAPACPMLGSAEVNTNIKKTPDRMGAKKLLRIFTRYKSS